MPSLEFEPAVEDLQPTKEQGECSEPDVAKHMRQENEISEEGGLSAKPGSGPPSPPPLSPPSSPDLRCGTSRSDSIAAVTPRIDEGATEKAGTDVVKDESGADGLGKEYPQESSAWGLLFGEAPRQKCASPPKNTATSTAPTQRSYADGPESSFDSYQAGFSIGTVRAKFGMTTKKQKKIFLEARTRKRNR